MNRLGSLIVAAFSLCAVKFISGLALSSTGTTEARVGDTVEFTCRVAELSFSSQLVKWAKIGNKNATFTKEISHHITVIYEEGHYEVTSTQEGGDQVYTFKIIDVRQYDDGAFKCFVEEKGQVIDQTEVSLTVRQPIASLELFVGPYKVDSSSPGVREFQMDQLDPNLVTRCLVEGSNPAPQVMFKIGEEDITAQLNRSDQKQVKGTDPKSIRYYVTDLDSTGTYNLDTSVQNKVISCSVWLNGDEDNKLDVRAVLKVKEPPKVECTNVTAQVGDRQVTIECTIKSLTKPERIRWFVGGKNGLSMPGFKEYRVKEQRDGENQVKVLLTIDWIEKKHLNTTYVLKAEVSQSDIEHAVRLHLNPFKLRLVNGSNTTAGRVEVFYNNAWGTVCDDDWDNTDAQVVCRMLDFPTSGAEVRRRAFFGKGTGPIHLSNVTCRGHEANLLQCSHNVTTSCDHSRDAGVVCPDLHPLNVRLVNGLSSREGRVEVYYNNVWGRICHTGFTNQDAEVVCRMLGFTSGAHVRSELFKKGTGPIHLSNVKCRGHEANLLQCSHNVTTSCDDSRDAGVVCPDPHTMKVRLVDGPSPNAGRVEIYYNNAWGTVCNDGWNKRNVQVVCRMLGFTTNLHKVRDEFFGKGTGPIHLSNVKCRRVEADLRQCPYSGTTICDHSEDVGIVCPDLLPPYSRAINFTTYIEEVDSHISTPFTTNPKQSALPTNDFPSQATTAFSVPASSANMATSAVPVLQTTTSTRPQETTLLPEKGSKLSIKVFLGLTSVRGVFNPKLRLSPSGPALTGGLLECARHCKADRKCQLFNCDQINKNCRLYHESEKAINAGAASVVGWKVYILV